MSSTGHASQLMALAWNNCALRNCRSLDQATEHLGLVGELIGLPKLGFVDNISCDHPLMLGEGRSLQHDVIRWCPKMLRWWYENRIFLKHPDVKHAAVTMLPFVSRVQDANPCALDPDEKQIREILIDAGLASELLIPVHRPGGGVSILGWASTTKGASEMVPTEVQLSLIATGYAFVDLVDRMRGETRRHHPVLTTRQRECLNLIARGRSVKEAAIALKLSPHTVQAYVKDAVKRMNARSRSELISMALASGELDDMLTLH